MELHRRVDSSYQCNTVCDNEYEHLSQWAITRRTGSPDVDLVMDEDPCLGTTCFSSMHEYAADFYKRRFKKVHVPLLANNKN
jgi:hypothetical protein